VTVLTGSGEVPALEVPALGVPALEATRELTVPISAERTLANGLTVIAIERRSVPLVEVRLRVPFTRTRIDPAAVATGALLGQTLLSGTADMSTVDIAAALQQVGGALSASIDADRLVVSGNGLAAGLGDILAILAKVLRGATYPDGEVATERARLIDRIQLSQSQPAHQVRVALLRRMYGEHPYAMQTPTIDDVASLGRAELAGLHAARVRPTGAALVLVGDIEATATLDLAEAALGSWAGAGAGEGPVPAPPLRPGPLVLADRPGAVQSSIRLALPAVGRTHPDHAALQLANLVFGGYFSSRWVENIREEKGYSYGPHSAVDHSQSGSVVIISAEVGTDVTAAAMLETWYEMGRMATIAPGAEELEQARQYALGSFLIGMSTQAGLAGLAITYAGFGLRLDYLAEHSARLARASRDEVAAAAATYLAPSGAVAVVLGDASLVEDPLSALCAVEHAPTEGQPAAEPRGG
jgi:predicted Zn-dependent peptidase